MGWWASEDGRGIIGDRPADILGTALADALGERFDTDLLAGFLASAGSALLRNPAALVCNVPLPPGLTFDVRFDDAPPVTVPVRLAPVATSLEDELFDALEAVAFQYHLSDVDRAPRVAELLETIAFAARGHVVDADTGRALTLRGIYARAERGARGERGMYDTVVASVDAMRLTALRALVAGATGDAAVADANAATDAGGGIAPDDVARIVADALDDADWRVRMLGVLAVGRLRIAALAKRARAAAVPDAVDGMSDDDRRALLAMRDAAGARALGSTLRAERPVHADAAVAARRAAFADEVDAFVAGTGLPAPDGPGHVLRALVDLAEA